MARREGARRATPPGRAGAPSHAERLDLAQWAYAESIARQMFGDMAGCIEALRRSHDILPTYAPAILAVASVEYQLHRPEEGWRLMRALLDLPDDAEDLVEIIDEAGGFLIKAGRHDHGLELYRRAAARFPRVAALHQGIGCCAGHAGNHEEAIAAGRKALELDPDNQKLVNDLGWSLHLAGRCGEARRVLERAVEMDPADTLAGENLRRCTRRRGHADPGSA